MKRLLFIFAVVLVLCSPVRAAWVDASYTLNNTPSPRVDDTIYNRLRGRAAYQCLTQIYNSSAIRYNNGVLQSDSAYDLTLYLYDQSGSYQQFLCNIVQLRVATLITYLQGSLENPGNLQVLAYVLIILDYYDNGNTTRITLPCFECLEIDITWNSLNNQNIDSLRFSRSSSNWAYPAYVLHSQDGSVTAGAYLTQNTPVNFIGATPILALAQQQQNTSFQTPQSWFNAWGQMFAQTYPIASPITTGYRLYDGQNLIIGTYPLQGISGYIAIDPRTSFSSYLNGDYDKGGQLDFSEFILGKDMKDPTDDNPNMQETVTDIIQVSPPSVDGPSDVFDDPVETPDESSIEEGITEVETGLTSVLEQNEGYQLLRMLINPVGFGRNVELPSWQKNISVTVFGSTWNIGLIIIDLNILRESPYANVWSKIRAVLVLNLFIQTWLVCYKIYEKALAFSA